MESLAQGDGLHVAAPRKTSLQTRSTSSEVRGLLLPGIIRRLLDIPTQTASTARSVGPSNSPAHGLSLHTSLWRLNLRARPRAIPTSICAPLRPHGTVAACGEDHGVGGAAGGAAGQTPGVHPGKVRAPRQLDTALQGCDRHISHPWG